MTSIAERDFLDVSTAADADTLQARLIAFAAKLDFGLVSAVLIRGQLDSPNAWGRSVSNTPPAFAAASKDRDNAKRDPVMARVMEGGLPLAYDQQLYVGAGAGDMWEMQAPFGYRNGLATASHTRSRDEHFVLGIDRPDALPKDEAKLLRLKADMRLLAVHAGIAAQRIFAPPPLIEPKEKLGRRELECLSWAARGKTARETGQILGITERGVRFHLANARAKLGGATTKHQAAFYCLEQGVIH